jgi:hypothetical protein
MPRAHTQEELAEAERLLKEGQPMIDQVTREQRADDQKWQKEIAMLERRVKEEASEIDLGNGDKLAIRSCLSDAEMERFGKLQATIEKKGKESTEATYQMLELVTANPYFTVDWFRQNRDRYATADMAALLFGWYEDRIKRQRKNLEQVKSAISFREE